MRKTSLNIFLSLLVAGVWIESVQSARVLGLFPTTSKSHLIIQMEVIKTLAERGHNVTVVTTLPLNDKAPKYRHIKLPDVHLPKDFFNKFIDGGSNVIESFKLAQFAITGLLNTADEALVYFKETSVWKEESFDLLVLGIFVNEFLVGVAGHFKCPIVAIDTHKPTAFMNSIIGNPQELSYVPSALSSDNQPLNFWERVRNYLFFIMDNLFTTMFISDVRQRYEKHFPTNEYPSIDELLTNITVTLHTSHFSEGLIRPVTPGFVQIGGIQSKPKPDPLPKDIAEILNNSSQYGAILFSFGTNALSSERDPQVMKKIFNVLSTLKQTVLWKWENDQFPGTAPNIIYKKWLPQDDVLAHPNTKLFISHCGLGSVVEAKFHGVPVLAIPLFGDQFGNANSLVDSGYGVQVDYLTLSEESFRQAIEEVLENPKYREKIQHFANLFRDRPMSIRDTAAFWMEYVIRHQGAKHIQSPAVKMTIIEYYGLDIFACFLVLSYIIYRIMKFCICKIYKMCKTNSELVGGKSKKD